MAIKPAGRAIIIALVAAAGAYGIHASGVLTPKATAPIPSPAITSQPLEPVTPPSAAPAELPKPAPSSVETAPSTDAIDALIRQSGKK